MPRQLPWKVNSSSSARPIAAPHHPTKTTTASPASSTTSHSPAPPKRHGEAQTPAARETPKPRRSLGLSSARSPSTSPPPEPLKEEFMIDGVDHDDKYRMVEDEFLAVAGDFTRHLHAAEYQRLKNLARTQNAETIQNISRPVTGEMSDLVRRRHAALDTAARQRRGTATALGKRARGGDGGGVLSPPASNMSTSTSLRGLMDSPRKSAIPLTSLASFVAPGKRLVVGSRGPLLDASRASPSRGGRESVVQILDSEDDDDDDDDDLDGHGAWPRTKFQNRQPPSNPGGSSAAEPSASSFKLPARPDARGRPTSSGDLISRSGNPATKVKREEVDSDDDDDDIFSRLRARREEEERNRKRGSRDVKVKTSESQTHATSLDEIPFLL